MTPNLSRGVSGACDVNTSATNSNPPRVMSTVAGSVVIRRLVSVSELATLKSGAGPNVTLPAVRSVLAAPSVSIREPDDMLLGAILVKLFNDRQLRVGEDVIKYILPRMERSFAAARDLVAQADKLALAEKKAVSIPLIRKILSAESA